MGNAGQIAGKREFRPFFGVVYPGQTETGCDTEASSAAAQAAGKDLNAMVSSIPSEKLKEILEKNGDSLLTNPGRCEGLLKDHCGAHRREISALVGALEERVPMELKSSWQTAMTPEAMRARMVQRLEDNRGLAPEVAGWAVDAWSYALGVGLERKSDRIDERNFASVVVGSAAGTPAVAAAGTPAVAAAGQRNLHGDRVPGSAAAGVASFPAAVAAMKPQKKAGAGLAALFLAGGIAYAVLHHPPAPAPVPAPLPGPSSDIVPPPKPAPSPAPAPAPTALAIGTPVSVSINQDFSSDELEVGQTLEATVVSPLVLHGNVIVPRGAAAVLRVTEVDQSGKYAGRSRVDATLTGITAGPHHYRVTTSTFAFNGPSQVAHTAERAGIGAAIGGAAGFIGGKLFHHAAAGTAVGAGAGAGVGAVTNKPRPVKVKAETVVQFRLSRPLSLGDAAGASS
jgi:hypothetical protein